MDRKELTSGEAEPMEYGYRIPFYSTMELFVETLTGTCFELRVSPFETVISVKAKIQRLEGIPISQQYLIWHNTELEDDYCLHDYSITDGCTLKLVLAMRGGPINTRRIAMDEPTFREMADYVDANQDEFFENLSTPPSAGNAGGNKQVTLLVYRDGDQLNFFRVVDRGDGTLTPLSESLSGGSLSNMEEEDDGEVANQRKLTLSQVVENNITASKMKQLRTHMHDLSIKGAPNSNKKPVMDENTSLAPTSILESPLKMSVVRRHLTFSPKGSTTLPKETPKLPPTTVRTTASSLLRDFASSAPALKQPPPSAEEPGPEYSLKSEQKLTNFEKQPGQTTENVTRTPKPPQREAEGPMTPRSDSEISEGEIILKSKKSSVKETGPSEPKVPMDTTSTSVMSSTATISKAELLRARLNRIKQAMNNNEAKAEGPKTPTPETLSLDALWKRQLSKSMSTSGAGESNKDSEAEVAKGKHDDSSGKRSPRTQRLLAALSNNGKTQAPTQSAKKKAPASTLPKFAPSVTQGLAFNRHEMYLRSYGLLPSPDDEPMEDVVKYPPPSFSDTTATKPRVEDTDPVPAVKAPPASKILETPHGVKYTTSGTGASCYSRPWYDRTPRSPGTVRDNSKSDCPTPYSLFHPYQRDLKPLVRPPQGYQLATPGHSRLGSLQNQGQRAASSNVLKASQGRPPSTWLSDRVAGNTTQSSAMTSSVHKWSGNLTQNQDKTLENDTGGATAASKDFSTNVGLHPRPPSSTTGVGGLRYHGRRQVVNKAPDKTRSTQSKLSTTTSAVRMNDSPHGKIETMSRQEAREVVDFINKAMDASILRSLVKSPSKETFRGGSGQSSLRHAPAPFHHYGDASRLMPEAGSKYSGLSSGRMGAKVDMNPLGTSRVPTISAQSRSAVQNTMLPPVKPSVTKKKRCFLCSKKTGLATSYTCRCGNNFCATHRYAETHDCTYDYKTRGRKILEENNPLVSAPKLPKI